MDAALFDTALARRRLARARGEGYADFLLARAAEDLDDRLAAILRRFPRALDLGTPTAAAAERPRRAAERTIASASSSEVVIVA